MWECQLIAGGIGVSVKWSGDVQVCVERQPQQQQPEDVHALVDTHTGPKHTTTTRKKTQQNHV
jgi:hypothetical protein